PESPGSSFVLLYNVFRRFSDTREPHELIRTIVWRSQTIQVGCFCGTDEEARDFSYYCTAVQQHYPSDLYFSCELHEKSGVRICGVEDILSVLNSNCVHKHHSITAKPEHFHNSLVPASILHLWKQSIPYKINYYNKVGISTPERRSDD
ncbi:hypothetical protein PV328_009146, partial [Microctonus aethiopoides]